MGRTMWGAAFLTVSSLLLLPAHTYAAPSLSGDDLDVFRETEDWQLGPGTQQGPPLSLAKKVYLRAFLKEGQEEPRLNRRGLQTEGLDINKFNSMTVDPEPPIKRVCLGSSLAPWPAPWVPLLMRRARCPHRT